VSQKVILSYLVFCHFLLPLQKKVTKEKEPGKDNRSCFSPFARGHFPLQKTGHGSHLFRFAFAHSKGIDCLQRVKKGGRSIHLLFNTLHHFLTVTSGETCGGESEPSKKIIQFNL